MRAIGGLGVTEGRAQRVDGGQFRAARGAAHDQGQNCADGVTDKEYRSLAILFGSPGVDGLEHQLRLVVHAEARRIIAAGGTIARPVEREHVEANPGPQRQERGARQGAVPVAARRTAAVQRDHQPPTHGAL